MRAEGSFVNEERMQGRGRGGPCMAIKGGCARGIGVRERIWATAGQDLSVREPGRRIIHRIAWQNGRKTLSTKEKE